MSKFESKSRKSILFADSYLREGKLSSSQKKVGIYAGLTPKHFALGTSVRGCSIH